MILICDFDLNRFFMILIWLQLHSWKSKSLFWNFRSYYCSHIVVQLSIIRLIMAWVVTC